MKDYKARWLVAALPTDPADYKNTDREYLLHVHVQDGNAIATDSFQLRMVKDCRLEDGQYRVVYDHAFDHRYPELQRIPDLKPEPRLFEFAAKANDTEPPVFTFKVNRRFLASILSIDGLVPEDEENEFRDMVVIQFLPKIDGIPDHRPLRILPRDEYEGWLALLMPMVGPDDT